MKTGFMLPAIGWHRELSESAKREIERRSPKLPVDKISREAGDYRITRDANANPRPQRLARSCEHFGGKFANCMLQRN
jgi:hypothetical protein